MGERTHIYQTNIIGLLKAFPTKTFVSSVLSSSIQDSTDEIEKVFPQ